jgi:tetratricopeptide (TPR) repeat protein
MDEKRRIKIEKILGFKIKREENPVDNQKEKDDSISDSLGHLQPDKKKLDLVKRIILTELKEDKKNELLWALIGHIYYLEKEFTKSINCFLKTISINSRNIDNWIDLGFSYRANGEFKKSDYIFWNYEKLAKTSTKEQNKKWN